MQGMQQSSRGRRPRAEAARTRARLVTAAGALFARRGIDAVSTREIATAAGVAHGLLRHHFGSKAGVWEAVIDAADREFAEAIEPLVAVMADNSAPQDADLGEDNLRAFVHGFVAACAARPDIARLLVHEGTVSSPRLDDLLGRLGRARQAVSAVAPHLRDSGSGVQLADEELLLVLLLHGMLPFGIPALVDGVLGRPLTPERQAEVLIDLLLR